MQDLNPQAPGITLPEPATGPPTQPRNEISARQLAANRRNAQKSTGPRTAAGKERSSRNRLEHGIYADVRPIDQGAFREDPLAVQALVDDVIANLQPRNSMERAAAVDVAKLQIQMGRHQVFETANLTGMTTDSRATVTGPGVFDAQFNAELYSDVAEILQRDPATYTPPERHDLLLAVAAFDPDVRRIYELLTLSDPVEPVEMDDTVLLAIERDHGSLEEASAWFAKRARREAERLPDQAAEERAAFNGVRYMEKAGTLVTHSLIYARLSAALDRALKRYQVIRQMTDDAIARAEEEDDDELYGGYDYDNPG
jgi:hypothetical protein